MPRVSKTRKAISIKIKSKTPRKGPSRLELIQILSMLPPGFTLAKKGNGISSRIINGQKYCPDCRSVKYISQFRQSTKLISGYCSTCNKCDAFRCLLRGVRERAAFEQNSELIELDDIRTIACDICPIFGVPLKFGEGPCCNDSATIDAIIHSTGHIKGNLACISHLANSIKSDATSNELLQIAYALNNVIVPDVIEPDKSRIIRHGKISTHAIRHSHKIINCQKWCTVH